MAKPKISIREPFFKLLRTLTGNLPTWTAVTYLLAITIPQVAWATLPSPMEKLQARISGAVADVTPSVAGIRALRKIRLKNGTTAIQERNGSGLIVDSRGFLVTCLHVIAKADSMEVSLGNPVYGRYPASLWEQDKVRDLALIKIDGPGPFPPARLGGNVKPGDFLLSMGNPLGFSHTVSLGIAGPPVTIPAPNSSVPINVIQTDAVINRGNSGGPLVDINGRAAGLCTALFSPTGTYRGVGYALPAETVKSFLDRSLPRVTLLPAVQQSVPGGIPASNTGTTPTVAKLIPPGELALKTVPVIFLSSIVLSMIGVGGGFIYVPVLLSSGMDFNMAATTSLIILALAQAAAVLVFLRSDLVDLRLFAVLEGPTMIGAFAGGIMAHDFHMVHLKSLFACALILAGALMLKSRISPQNASTGYFTVSPMVWEYRIKDRSIVMDLGLAVPLTFGIGFIGGLLGFGGGWLKIPLMVLMFHVPMKIAVATSSMMVPVTALAGFLGHSSAVRPDLGQVLILSLWAVAGALIGSYISLGADSRHLRVVFSFILCITGAWMMFKQ